jgi:myosin heavy subunit
LGSECYAITTEDSPRFLSLTSTGSTYIQEYESLSLEPHLLEVSARAYRGVLLDASNQTILLSGLSGSGKTRSYRRLLEHLVSLDGLSTDTVVSHGKIHQAMLDHVRSSTPLLEIFGSATTPMSRSSTRFALITTLHFELQCTGLFGFAGSCTETYLLETSRVADRSLGLNFHSLYRMLELPAKIKGQLLGLRWTEAKAGDFAYLQGVEQQQQQTARGGDSGTGPEQMLTMLEDFQCSTLHVRDVFRALASVLCLGNLTFTPSRENGESSAIYGRTDLDRLASCIGIDGALIEQCLTTATTHVNGEVFVTEVSPALARSACDTLAKTIYGFVFDAVTRAVNEHTAGALQDDREYGVVRLIDVCGVENLKVNRYEQLCVNYTNEKLQQKYLLDHRSSLLSECEKEGVDIFSSTRIDNSTIVLAFLEGSGGLFETLKDVNRRVDGGNTVSGAGYV